MTIRPLHRLTPKSTGILLMVCNVLALDGVDLPLYLSMVYLTELGKNYLRLPDDQVDKIRLAQALAIAEMILLSVSTEEWFTLGSKGHIHPKVIEELVDTGWIPERRTLMSWTQYYEPQNWLELRIVPLEHFQERESNTQPYSSYTKGYHESGKGYRRDGKTYGQDTGPRYQDPIAGPLEEESVHPLEQDPNYQRLQYLILRYKQVRQARLKK